MQHDPVEAATQHAVAREALRAQSEAIVAAATPAPAPKPEPVARTKVFRIRHEYADGKVLDGQFTNRILSVQEQIAVGVLRANLSGGVRYDLLDPATVNLTEMVAQLQVSLIERPDWARDLLGLDDVDLIAKIYTEVAAHEATFRRARTPS